MVALIIFAARFVQITGAVILFGTPLFFLLALADRPLPWGGPLVRWSGAWLLAGAVAGLLAQTAAMAGDPAMAFDLPTLGMVVSGTAFGMAICVRMALAALMILVSVRLHPGRGLWQAATGAGAVILASFAWTGHGAAEAGIGGVVHAASDVVHLLAAGVWLGALIAFARLLWDGRSAPDNGGLIALHRALEGFSGMGSLVVAVLLATGLVNSWFLVGPGRLHGLVTSPYGWLLVIKVGLFAAMLVLAAENRFRLTPSLGRALSARADPTDVRRRLGRSVLIETALGFGVLVLVSILGMLAPVSAQV